MLLIWILLGTLLCLVVVLAIPLELAFRARIQAAQRSASGQLRWLFGLVRVNLTGPTAPEIREKPQKPRPSRPRKRPRSSPWAALSVEGLVGHVLTLVRRVLRAIHVHHLDVDARLGLGDPADTGRLWALLGPLGVLLAAPAHTRIELQPDFTEAVLMFDGDGRIRLVPLQLLFLLLVFMLSPTTLRAFRAMRA